MRTLNVVMCAMSLAIGGLFASCEDDLHGVRPEFKHANLSQSDGSEQVEPVNAGVVELSVSACDLYQLTVTLTGGFPTLVLKGDGECQGRMVLPPGEYPYSVVARGCLRPNGPDEKVLVCTPASGVLRVKQGETSRLEVSVSYATLGD